MAVGSFFLGLRLNIAIDISVLWLLAVVLTLWGLLILRRRAYGNGADAIRRWATLLIPLFSLAALGDLAGYIPGLMLVGWLGVVVFPAWVVMALLLHAVARYCRQWELSRQAGEWRRAFWAWSIVHAVVLVGSVAAAAAVGSKVHSLPGWAALLAFGCWFLPGILMIAAAQSAVKTEKLLRGGCASCGFDLRGLREPVCPECGLRFAPARLSLAPPQQRRLATPWGILSACTLAAAALAGLTHYQIPGMYPAAGKPMWLVVRDASRAVPINNIPRTDRDAAFRSMFSRSNSGPTQETMVEGAGATDAQDEILARLAAKTAQPKQVADLIDLALAIQGDKSRPVGNWGRIMDALAAAGVTTTEQNRQFFLNSLVWTLKVRPKVTEGGCLPMEIWAASRGIDFQSSSLPDFGDLVNGVQIEMRSLTGDGRPLGPLPEMIVRQGGGTYTMNWVLCSQRGEAIDPALLPVANIPVGERTIEAVLNMRWKQRRINAINNAAIPANALPEEWTVRVSAPTHVLPIGTSSVQQRSDAEWDRRFASSRVEFRADQRFLSLSVNSWSTPAQVPVIADLVVSTPDGEMTLGTAFLGGDGFGRSVRINPEARDLLETTEFTVVRLRPNAEIAELLVEGTEIWAGPEQVIDMDKVNANRLQHRGDLRRRIGP